MRICCVLWVFFQQEFKKGPYVRHSFVFQFCCKSSEPKESITHQAFAKIVPQILNANVPARPVDWIYMQLQYQQTVRRCERTCSHIITWATLGRREKCLLQIDPKSRFASPRKADQSADGNNKRVQCDSIPARVLPETARGKNSFFLMPNFPTS